MGVLDAHLRGGEGRAAAAPGALARLRPHAVPLLVVAAALGLALASLLIPSSPSYDPFAWLVWGRELTDPARTFGLAGGPSWKPLPALVTAPLALLSASTAPDAWLVVVRSAMLLALAGGWAVGTRLAGRWAGALIVLGLLLLGPVASLTLRGASEPLLLACVLWGVERQLAGHRSQAYVLAIAAGLIRPEAFAFAALYAAWCWRTAGGRERALLAGGFVLVPVAWLGPPATLGDALSASHYATAYEARANGSPTSAALQRGLALAIAPVWVLAVTAVALRPRDRTIWALALGGLAWLGVVVVMTAAGYPGLGRFMLPTAAVACVLAAVAVVELIRRLVRVQVAAAVLVGAALAATVGAFAVTRVRTEAADVREATSLARMQRELTSAVAAAGGPAVVLACGSV
ncbi:MAG: hypothetical protein ACTHOE_13980, partial [Conexibacter sp.]